MRLASSARSRLICMCRFSLNLGNLYHVMCDRTTYTFAEHVSFILIFGWKNSSRWKSCATSGSVTARVQRLTQLASQPDSLPVQKWMATGRAGRAMLVILVIVLSLACFNPHTSALIHQVMERIVSALQ